MCRKLTSLKRSLKFYTRYNIMYAMKPLYTFEKKKHILMIEVCTKRDSEYVSSKMLSLFL